jgi:hypothetical protein
MKLLTHMNGGTVETFVCSECLESCHQVPVHVTGWAERFCCLGHARDFFHNLNVRRRERVH